MSDSIADTPEPPYYAVIFTSTVTDEDPEGYAAAAERMQELAARQDGFLGFESAREKIGMTVSYWRSLADAQRWRENAEHQAVQRRGISTWYRRYRLRVCLVERDVEFTRR